MRRTLSLAVLALTLTAGACGGTTEQQFTAADATAIRRASADLTAAFNAKEVDKILSLYADNSVFMPPNAPLLRGRDPLKSFFANLTGTASDLKMDAIDVAGHGPIGYASGSYSLKNKGFADRGKFLIVMRNMMGTWRFEYTMWSSDLPARVSGN
jgi:ketosteroid isomerase-like protein